MKGLVKMKLCTVCGGKTSNSLLHVNMVWRSETVGKYQLPEVVPPSLKPVNLIHKTGWKYLQY